MPLLEGHNLSKTYRMGKALVPVLRGASISLNQGEFVAVLGASGSGKSTLMHLLGGLDRPDSSPAGFINFAGVTLSSLSTRALDDYRTRSVGFVFQFYHLLPELSVMENALLPAMVLYGKLGYLRKRSELRARAESLLSELGLGHRLRHRSNELSGGERQRVAIARALINDPPLLLADEPTGNLDTATGSKVLDALLALRSKSSRTMLIVTHDPNTAARADRIVQISDGKVHASA